MGRPLGPVPHVGGRRGRQVVGVRGGVGPGQLGVEHAFHELAEGAAHDDLDLGLRAGLQRAQAQEVQAERPQPLQHAEQRGAVADLGDEHGVRGGIPHALLLEHVHLVAFEGSLDRELDDPGSQGTPFRRLPLSRAPAVDKSPIGGACALGCRYGGADDR